MKPLTTTPLRQLLTGVYGNAFLNLQAYKKEYHRNILPHEYRFGQIFINLYHRSLLCHYITSVFWLVLTEKKNENHFFLLSSLNPPACVTLTQ